VHPNEGWNEQPDPYWGGRETNFTAYLCPPQHGARPKKQSFMSKTNLIESKIFTFDTAVEQVKQWQDEGLDIVFTNGCFDILHIGHLKYLQQAAQLGDKLVVAINGSESVKRLKGPTRPVNDDDTRAWQMAAIAFVDLVVFFEEDTPINLIEALTPDYLVKGGDYVVAQIVGADWVIEHGGEVKTLPFVAGYSTTATIQKMK
jgi:D-glycero-beta-D-manno-heptose 1-phosphate adenylyltransferase